jgi:hypothetical protein
MKAFPLKAVNQFDDSEGMDLRDYFAAQMLASVFSSTAKSPPSLESVAKAAYAMADAMMEAREQG